MYTLCIIEDCSMSNVITVCFVNKRIIPRTNTKLYYVVDPGISIYSPNEIVTLAQLKSDAAHYSCSYKEYRSDFMLKRL